MNASDAVPGSRDPTVRREDALENNLSWYRAMMDAHGVGHESTTHWWSASERVPPYYSNVVTRTPDGTHEQLVRIGELAADPPSQRWGVADSFACLDADAMRSLGLGLLFEAEWFGASPVLRDTDEGAGIRFVRVQDERGLAAWERRWQAWSPAPGRRVFPQALLGDPDRAFWTAQRDGASIGGAITHANGETLGLSNVFVEGQGARGDFLRAAARLAFREAGARSVVGYGSPEELRDLVPLGFVGLGKQRVWLSGA